MGSQVVEQPALFDDVDDSALLFRGEEGLAVLRKRYTADQVQEMEWKRNAIVMLLASDWPVEVIARQLHVNLRTVTALAKRNGEDVAGFTRQFATILMRTGGRWVGLARTKEDSASFKDLMIGAGIAMQHARELNMMGEGAEEKVVKEEQDHAQAAAALRAMMSATSAGLGGPGIEPTAPRTAPSEAEATESPAIEQNPIDAESVEGGRGGGQFGAAGGEGLTRLREGGLSGKGPDE